MDLFFQLATAAGLGGGVSAILQHFLRNRSAFIEWHMKSRNEAMFTFFDELVALEKGTPGASRQSLFSWPAEHKDDFNIFGRFATFCLFPSSIINPIHLYDRSAL